MARELYSTQQVKCDLAVRFRSTCRDEVKSYSFTLAVHEAVVERQNYTSNYKCAHIAQKGE